MKELNTLLASFPTVRDAAPLLKWLDEQGVSYDLKQPRNNFDPFFAYLGKFDKVGIFVAQDQHESLAVRLKGEEFIKEEEDPFFASFSKQELREVVERADEWEPDQVARAEALLAKMGIRYSETEKAEMRALRKAALRRPKSVSLPILIIGVLLAVFNWLAVLDLWLDIDLISDVVPGVLVGYSTLATIGFGLIVTFLTLRDPWGDRFFAFDVRTRNWGFAMLFLSAALIIATITYSAIFS